DSTLPPVRADRSRPRESPETRQPAGTSAAPVVRSPADVLRLVVAAGVVVLLLVVGGVFGDALVAFTSDLLRGLDAIPTWLVDVIVVGTRVLAVIMLGGGLVHAVLHSRWRMLLTVTAAGLLAAA